MVTIVVKAHENGVLQLVQEGGRNNSISPQEDAITTSTNWDWYSSIFFATTVVTTIGSYGI